MRSVQISVLFTSDVRQRAFFPVRWANLSRFMHFCNLKLNIIDAYIRIGVIDYFLLFLFFLNGSFEIWCFIIDHLL